MKIIAKTSKKCKSFHLKIIIYARDVGTNKNYYLRILQLEFLGNVEPYMDMVAPPPKIEVNRLKKKQKKIELNYIIFNEFSTKIHKNSLFSSRAEHFFTSKPPILCIFLPPWTPVSHNYRSDSPAQLWDYPHSSPVHHWKPMKLEQFSTMLSRNSNAFLRFLIKLLMFTIIFEND